MSSTAKRFELKDVFSAALSLAVIAGGMTALLAFTDLQTRNNIAARAAEAADRGRRLVMDADRFEEKQTEVDGKTVIFHEAYDGDEMVGYVFSVKSSGKSAGLVLLTGIDTSGTVTGVAVTQNNETAGYVDKVEKAGFLDAFEGRKADRDLVLNKDVDSVAQATKTAKGILEGVNDAMELYRRVSRGG